MLHAAIAGTDLIDGAIVRAAAGDRPVTPDRDQPGPRASRSEPLDARIADLEARLEQQDVALRRLLHLLVDWSEAPATKPRDRAA
jgi:hypothetical protein